MSEQILWLIQTIITAATLIGAVSAIAKPISSMLKAQREHQKQTEEWCEEVEERLETLERKQTETWLETLRHKIYSSSLPLAERVNAGELYIKHGGNGTAKVQHEQNLRAFQGQG